MADPDDGSAPTERGTSPPSKLLIAMVILSHAMNHFQGGVLPVLYPAIIAEFEIDYVQLGIMQFAASFATGFPQMFVAFLRRLVSGKVLLGVGNLVSSLFNMAASLAGSVQHFIALRVVSGVGSSPQHPVGAALLTSHTSSAWRGRVFGLNLSVPMVGSTLAPLIGASLLLLVGWRATLLVIAVPVLLAALAQRPSEDRVVLRGLIASPDGRRIVRASAEAALADAALAGSRAADEVLREGAASILEAIRAEAIG